MSKGNAGSVRASIIQQEYLAEAYRIAHYQGDNPYITTSALAERMNVSAPAVAAVVERLKRAGFVEHEPYRGMRLTPKGEREALMNIRRHRLAEVFLVKVMGFAWHEVHDEADAIGAVISESVAARMERMAGFPKRCPHGEPIPTAEGEMPTIQDTPLSEIDEVPADLIVSRVNSHDPEVLKYLASLQIVPEQTITMLSRAPFNGPLRLRIGKQEQVIGYELARGIRVTPA
ncbi:MAG: metal-dependent transcriptional regulator [Chloroflexi bacterium CFX4]|nr:metal-dependent transcriptional regulator [Chloroflexi bacterium CFX4]MDL1921555.1 metal-dependent transcriptional regulator [Chloroflexi bacterium CFX3]